METIGVISDTHIPDRARRLDPRVLPIFSQAGVKAILHAGDVSVPGVLEQLSKVAPVHAVRGNRDWLALGRLPRVLRLTFEGVTLGMAHGHGGLLEYVIDRGVYLLHGPDPERYLPRLLQTFPDVRVIVFGHVHNPMARWVNGQLLFNPGSPHFPDRNVSAPSVGLLHIRAGGAVEGEIVLLKV